MKKIIILLLFSFFIITRCNIHVDADKGVFLAAYAGTYITLYDASGNKIKTIFTGININGFDFSPDGTRIIIAEGATTSIKIISITGKLIKNIPNTTGMEFPAWSPNGNCFACDFGGNGIYIFDFDGNIIKQITNPANLRKPNWHPSGQYIIASEGSLAYQISVADINNYYAISTTGSDLYPSYSPDGKSIVYCYNSSINTITVDGSNEKTNIHTADPGSCYFSRDGNYIYFIFINMMTEIWKCDIDGNSPTRFAYDPVNNFSYFRLKP